MYPDLWKFDKNEKFNPIQWQPGPRHRFQREHDGDYDLNTGASTTSNASTTATRTWTPVPTQASLPAHNHRSLTILRHGSHVDKAFKPKKKNALRPHTHTKGIANSNMVESWAQTYLLIYQHERRANLDRRARRSLLIPKMRVCTLEY